MATEKVPYFKWRNGRPRWEPGPRLRGLGFPGRDLKDGNGRWLGKWDALKRAAEINAEVAARRSGGMSSRRRGPLRPARSATCCANLWALYKASPRWREKLSPSTRRDYESKAAVWLATFGDRDVASIRPSHLYGWWEELARDRGHAMANGTVAVARLALSYAVKKDWVATNPAMRLGLDGLEPRTVMWTPEEALHLVQTADAMGQVAIADAFVLALHTGQRRGDVISLMMPALRGDGWADFKQSKTGARVSVPFTPALADRLEAIRRRRHAGLVVGLAPREAVLDETGQPYTGDTFSAAWRRVRAAAAAAMPSITGKTFADLRDTAVTRLALAGCSAMQIRAITGHSLETVHAIMKHYLVLDSRMARSAIDKLNTWMQEEGIAI